jgi:hypothetical protein
MCTLRASFRQQSGARHRIWAVAQLLACWCIKMQSCCVLHSKQLLWVQAVSQSDWGLGDILCIMRGSCSQLRHADGSTDGMLRHHVLQRMVIQSCNLQQLYGFDLGRLKRLLICRVLFVWTLVMCDLATVPREGRQATCC